MNLCNLYFSLSPSKCGHILILLNHLKVEDIMIIYPLTCITQEQGIIHNHSIIITHLLKKSNNKTTVLANIQ